jgi:peptidoglycan hydrolase-like protein with peptidoglycan-binding domain
MSAVKPAGVIILAATLVACAKTYTPMLDEPVLAADPMPKPTEAPSAMLDEPATATAPEQPRIKLPEAVLDKRTIESAQRTLNRLGFNAGKPDGVAGRNTQQAIRAFQKARGLAEDGQLSVALADKLKAETTIIVRAGDLLVYTDGETELVSAEREVRWNEGGDRSPIAIRPSMTGWPSAARTGLDWAVSHALDDPTMTVKWSSTGVGQKYEIHAYELLPGEATLAGGDSKFCRRYEMRTEGRPSFYPAIACRDGNGVWYIPNSSIRLARPATELGALSSSNAR